MFDAAQYLAANPDVAASGLDTYDHYVRYGYEEERLARRRRSIPAESRALATRARQQDNLIDRIVDLEADKRALFKAWDRHLHRVGQIGFDDLASPSTTRSRRRSTGATATKPGWRRPENLGRQWLRPEARLHSRRDPRSLH